MITRRAAAAAVAAALSSRAKATFTGPPPKRGVDQYGNTFTEYLIAWTPSGNLVKRIYDKIPKRQDGSGAPGAVGVEVRPRIPPDQVSAEVTQQNFDAAKQKLKDENSNVIVDDKATASSYSFGNAGTGAVVTSFAYGVAASIAGLPDQAERIAALQAEVVGLQNSLAAQLTAQADAGAAIATELAQRGARLDALLGQGTSVQGLTTLAQALDVNERMNLFATTDIVFAQKLHQVNQALSSAEAAARPPGCLQFGRSLVRQSDAEHAAGNVETAEEIYGLARTIADFAIGIDPVSGAIRSTYELVSGANPVTGQPLSSAERGFAAVNLALLGGFSTISKGLQAISRAAAVMGGSRGMAVIQTVFTVASKWPVKTIDRILGWRTSGLAAMPGETVALKVTKEIVPVGAVDGVYARVMPRQYAEQLFNGGLLAKGNVAFITEAQQLANLHRSEEIARRLGLMELSQDALRPAALSDHVVVEFKFASNEPLAFLAKPFGEAGAFGPAFLPGGFTSGGAVEWVIDSESAKRGLIDLGSLKWRLVLPP